MTISKSFGNIYWPTPSMSSRIAFIHDTVAAKPAPSSSERLGLLVVPCMVCSRATTKMQCMQPRQTNAFVVHCIRKPRH
jgi:hypothetical protein